MRRGALVATLALALFVAAAAAGPRTLANRALLARLRRQGRAEAALTLTRSDALGGPPRPARGKLALELPRYARLDFPASGERLTLRGDRGDWIQPGPRQLVRGGPRSAAAAMRWWAVLLDTTGSILEETLPGGGLRLRAPDDPDGPAQVVWLGRDGLPARLRVTTENGDTLRYTLSNWRFARPRGSAAFTLTAPPGYETVDLP